MTTKITTPHTHIECDDAARAAQVKSTINFNRWQTIRFEVSFISLGAGAAILTIAAILFATLKG
jgi:hypothetical protein